MVTATMHLNVLMRKFAIFIYKMFDSQELHDSLRQSYFKNFVHIKIFRNFVTLKILQVKLYERLHSNF